MMLASLGAAAIDGMPDPATGRIHRDPHQAAELIDVLILLREKTEGRLTAEENQVLGELIYDLQMRYMSATKRSG